MKKVWEKKKRPPNFNPILRLGVKGGGSQTSNEKDPAQVVQGFFHPL
jgi:hypothetical protein